MPHKHSSDSDDVPLDSDDVPLDRFKAPNCLHEADSWPCEFCDTHITSIKLRKHSSESDDVPLHSYKAHNSLYKKDSLPCDFCDHISTSIFASFKHNATHIIIPLVNLTLYQCEECTHNFTSLEELTTHVEVKNHSTSQVPPKTDYDIILQSIIKKQLVVKCHDLFNDIKQHSEIRHNSTEVSKEINPENDSTVSKTENVSVKTELPTYVISDSDSNGRNSPPSDTEGQSIKREGRNIKLEVFQTKPIEHTPKTRTENLPGGNGVQSSLIHTECRSVTPLHRKWQLSSDSDSHSDIKVEQCLPLHTEGRSDIDANINEDSKMKFYHSDEELTEVDQSVFKYTTLDDNSSPNRRSSSDYEPIRSRLVFEDDLDDVFNEEILPDIPLALPNMGLLRTTPTTTFKPNSIILGSQTNGITVKKKFFGNGPTANVNNLKISDIVVEQNVLEVYPESVPYETLVETQICDCRYCGRCFCNRMQLISHEATHLRIRKPRPSLCVYCERFYAGNYRSLRRHVEAKHPEIDPDEKRPHTQICKICNLSYYNFQRHERNYHQQMQENRQQTSYRKHRYKTFKVCDLCLNWVKNDHIYKFIGSHSEVGSTQKCCKCQNRHFTINIVTRRRFAYQKMDVNKSMSNEERLVRIKKKLNMIKRMNKCFCGCFI